MAAKLYGLTDVDGKLTLLSALAIFAAVALAVWGGRTLYALHFSTPSAGHQTDQTETQEEAADTNHGAAGASLTSPAQANTYREKKAKHESTNNGERTGIRWLYFSMPHVSFDTNFWIAVFTGVLAGVAFLQVGIVNTQTRIMDETLAEIRENSSAQANQFSKQLDLTEDSLRTQLRAYIGVADMFITPSIAEPDQWYVNFTVKNFGQTPGFKVVVETEKIGEAVGVNDHKYGVIDPEDAKPGLIKISQNFVDAARNTPDDIRVAVIIKYCDFKGRGIKRTTKYGPQNNLLRTDSGNRIMFAVVGDSTEEVEMDQDCE